MTTRTQSSMMGGAVEPVWAVVHDGVPRPTETPGVSVVVAGIIHKAAGRNNDGVTKDYPIVCANGTTKLTPALPSAGFKRISAVDVADNGSTDGVAIITNGTDAATGVDEEIKQTGSSFPSWVAGMYYLRFRITNGSGRTKKFKSIGVQVGETNRNFVIRAWKNPGSTPVWTTASPDGEWTGTNGSNVGGATQIACTSPTVSLANGDILWIIMKLDWGGGNGVTYGTTFSVASGWTTQQQMDYGDGPAGTTFATYGSGRWPFGAIICYEDAAAPAIPDIPPDYKRLAQLGDASAPLLSTTTTFQSEGGTGSSTVCIIKPNATVLGWNKP